MSLNENDRGWIKNAIAEALRAHFRGWKEAVRIYSLPSVCVALLVLAFTQWDKYVEFRTHTVDRLDRIEASLLDVRASQSPAKVLKEISQLQLRDFGKALPALHKITERPFTDVAPSQTTLREVADKLRVVDQATPDYWPTVLRFIQFASAGMSPSVPPPGTKANVIIGQNTGFALLGPFKNCVAELDGGDLGPTRFENCRVRFTQNSIRFLNVTFVNCVFEMPDTTSPSPYLKRTSQILLASNLQEVSVGGI